jgi:hypothetical protein
MQKFGGPIKSDGDLFKVLNQACDNLGDYKEEKWKTFTIENGLSIFKAKT